MDWKGEGEIGHRVLETDVGPGLGVGVGGWGVIAECGVRTTAQDQLRNFELPTF